MTSGTGTTYRYQIIHPGHANHGVYVEYRYRLRYARADQAGTVTVNGENYREADVAGGFILEPVGS